jgi:hypothetical protein
LDLQVLQGKWSCISPNQNSGTERKCLEIQREIVLLTIRDPAGKISFRARGELELRDGGAIPLRTISKGIPQPDDTQVCI